METLSALLAIYAGNSPVPDILFDLHPNKRLSKQSWGWWFETASRQLWRNCNDTLSQYTTSFVALFIFVEAIGYQITPSL